MLIRYNKFNLRIAQVIRVSISLAMIILIAAIIMNLTNAPYAKDTAFIGLILVILSPVMGVLAVALRSFNTKRWTIFTMAVIIFLIYIVALVISL